MITRFITQPFGPTGGPQTFGSALTAEIASVAYVNLEIWVAYATAGGTSRLYGPLRDFVQRGGHARVYMGLSNGVTSLQAADHLLRAGATVFGFETGGTVLFHPKIYLLTGGQFWLSIGSSNLTSEGLYRNVETNSISTGDPGNDGDRHALEQVVNTLNNLRQMADHCRAAVAADLPGLVASGALQDETLRPPQQRVSRAGGGQGRGRAPLRVPAAPPPHPDLGSLPRQRPAPPSQAQPAAPVLAAPAAPVVAAPPAQPHFFAMTLSAFDTSHRRGVKGTPEVSLPEESIAFFPAVSIQGRQYPDAYFDVLLNERDGTTRIVQYRLWQRPAGSDVGHADWRINVKHDTVEQTRQEGGDILLIERLSDGSVPLYEAWIVRPGDPEYPNLLARCTSTVQARGAAGVKRYGIY